MGVRTDVLLGVRITPALAKAIEELRVRRGYRSASHVARDCIMKTLQFEGIRFQEAKPEPEPLWDLGRDEGEESRQEVTRNGTLPEVPAIPEGEKSDPADPPADDAASPTVRVLTQEQVKTFIHENCGSQKSGQLLKQRKRREGAIVKSPKKATPRAAKGKKGAK